MKKWKKVRKRIVLMAMAVILAGITVDLSTLTVSATENTQNETITSGYCGKDGGTNLTWNFEQSTDTLTISGSGAMADYTYFSGSTDAPWYPLKDSITTVEIGKGVTNIGAVAFAAGDSGLTSQCLLRRV